MKTIFTTALIGAALFGGAAFLVDMSGGRSTGVVSSVGFATVYFLLGFILFGIVAAIVSAINKGKK